MRLPRFTIRSLLGVVLPVSVALASLRTPTDAWDSGILGLTVLTLLTAILLAVHRTNPRRAYWLGFAVFGWTYLVASSVPPVGSRLPTTQGLADFASALSGQEAVSTVLYRMLVSGGPGGSGTPQPIVADLAKTGTSVWDDILMFTRAAPPGSASTHENFVRIGHSLLALVVALIGGGLSRSLYDRSRVEIVSGEVHPSDERRRP